MVGFYIRIRNFQTIQQIKESTRNVLVKKKLPDIREKSCRK